MITVSNVSLQFGGDTLFKNVNLQFNAGNCYGVIGANGAGKSTFLKILCGVLPPTTGEVTIPKELRMSVLKQDHFAYDAYTVLDTVIMGNERLYAIMQEKRCLVCKAGLLRRGRQPCCGTRSRICRTGTAGKRNRMFPSSCKDWDFPKICYTRPWATSPVTKR